MDQGEAFQRIKDSQKRIREILGVFKGVSFPIIVESSTNFKVIPIDIKQDSNLIKDLSYIADNVTKRYHKNSITRETYKSIIGRTPKSFRPNEVGKILEYEIPNIPKNFQTIKELLPLKQPGYPDIKAIEKSGRVVFIDIKATTRPDLGSPRDFYYSTKETIKKKLDSDAIHLLIGLVIKEIKAGNFITIGWKLVDLSKIKVSMKAEFNADNREIYKKESIIAEDWMGDEN